MVSKLFQQTAGGALVVGIVFALVDLEYFVPGLFFGAVAALLTFGIRDPQQSVLDILKKETDTNIFKAFIEDLFSRIDQFGSDGAEAALLLDGKDYNSPKAERVVTIFVPLDIIMCSDEMMTNIKNMRKSPEDWKTFLFSHIVDMDISPLELKKRKSVTTLSGRVILLEKMREAGVEFLPYCATNGTMYKIRSTLMPGRFVKDASHVE